MWFWESRVVHFESRVGYFETYFGGLGWCVARGFRIWGFGCQVLGLGSRFRIRVRGGVCVARGVSGFGLRGP